MPSSELLRTIGLHNILRTTAVYHICAKSTPDKLTPFASLTVTYAVGAALSLLLYFCTAKGSAILQEYKQLNWTSFVLGLAIVGLEAGNIYLYKAGWDVSVGQIICSALLAVVLLFVGWMVYREAITLKKAAGLVICLVGLYLLGR